MIKKHPIVGVFVIILLLSGCTKTYPTAEEALQAKFSGDVNDLEYCEIIINMNGKLLRFAPLAIDDDKRTCTIIKNDCRRNNCQWYESVGAKGSNNKYEAVFAGRCACSSREE
jgi:hypothetical protein